MIALLTTVGLLVLPRALHGVLLTARGQSIRTSVATRGHPGCQGKHGIGPRARSAPAAGESGAAGQDWPTYDHDGQRTGANVKPSVLAPKNVSELNLTWQYDTSGPVKSSVVFVTERSTSVTGQATRTPSTLTTDRFYRAPGAVLSLPHCYYEGPACDPPVRILITGASGFIGRYLTAHLEGQGHEVVGTYLTQEELLVRDVPKKGVRWVHLNMQNPQEIDSVLRESRADAVFHLAAQAYAKKAWSDPLDTFRTNVLGTISLYEALRRTPAREGTLITASAAAYGVAKELPIREDSPLNPTNPYGVSKACQDMLSLQYSLNFDLRIVRARLFGTTGPGKTGDALNDFAQQVARLERAGAPGTLKVGNLSTRRDIADIRDVVRALWLVFEKGTPAEPVNVGAGRSYSIGWIAETLAKLSRIPLKIQSDSALLRPTDEPENRADLSRLTALGYKPEFPIERTIADALEFWRAA